MDSLKSKILELAERNYPNFINGGVFERLALEVGKKPSNASRRARELVASGKLERRLNEKKSVEYRIKETPKVETIKIQNALI